MIDRILGYIIRVVVALLVVLLCSPLYGEMVEDLGTIKGEVGEVFMANFPITITTGIFRKTKKEVMVSCKLIVLEINNGYILVDIKEIYGHNDIKAEIRALFPKAVKTRREYEQKEDTSFVLPVVTLNCSPQDLLSR